MRNIAYFGLAIAVAIAATMLIGADPAFAQGTTTGSSGGIFSTLQTKSQSTFSNVRIIMFVIAGFGIVGMAGMAFFGKFDWRWSFSMVGGLVILAAAGGIIYYATNSTADTGNISNSTFSDTLY